MENLIHIASSSTDAGVQLPELMAGESPALSTPDLAITAAGIIPQHTPLQRDATTGALEPWVAGEGEIAALTMYAIPIGTSRAAMAVAGCFNIDAINWPDGTTEAEVQAEATGMLVFRKLLYSKQRTGNEGDPGEVAGPA